MVFVPIQKLSIAELLVRSLIKLYSAKEVIAASMAFSSSQPSTASSKLFSCWKSANSAFAASKQVNELPLIFQIIIKLRPTISIPELSSYRHKY